MRGMFSFSITKPRQKFKLIKAQVKILQKIVFFELLKLPSEI